MSRRQSHAETVYLVRNDNLPTIDFTLRDNERAAHGYYLDPMDPETWRPVDLTGKQIVGWFKELCKNGRIMFGIPVLRHAPFEEGRCTLLGSPSTLMDVKPGWYEVEIEVTTCQSSYKQTVWKRFKFCVREDFDTEETFGMTPPIYRDEDGNLQELPVTPPNCIPEVFIPNNTVTRTTDNYTINGTANDPDGVIQQVQYRLNRGAWFAATGTNEWTATVTGLEFGENLIEVRSLDDSGACSPIDYCVVVREINIAPTITVDCNDDVTDEDPNACFDDIARGTTLGISEELPQAPSPEEQSRALANIRSKHLYTNPTAAQNRRVR